MRENIRQVIYDALAEINATRGGARQLEVSDATVLLGTDSSMESIELVNLIVSTEMLIEERHGLWEVRVPYPALGRDCDVVELGERLADELPMIALLPLHQDGRSGVDAVAEGALDVYEALDFETVELEPVDESGQTFGTITESLYRPDPDTIPAPEALRWRELPTPEREIRFVARELRTELANGRDPDDLAVVVPGTEAYSGYVEDTFDTFDIPHVTTAASQLNRTFTGSVVHDLLNLAEPDPRAEDLTSLLANPLVDIVGTVADEVA